MCCITHLLNSVRPTAAQQSGQKPPVSRVPPPAHVVKVLEGRWTFTERQQLKTRVVCRRGQICWCGSGEQEKQTKEKWWSREADVAEAQATSCYVDAACQKEASLWMNSGQMLLWPPDILSCPLLTCSKSIWSVWNTLFPETSLTSVLNKQEMSFLYDYNM